jgi:hypothetical protein
MTSVLSVQAIAVDRVASDTNNSAARSSLCQMQRIPAPPIVNPSLRLDAALGLVVIEFHNDAGVVTDSIPNARQLQAYRRWQTTQLGSAPLGFKASTVAPMILPRYLSQVHATPTKPE